MQIEMQSQPNYATTLPAHPNEVDRKRIERALTDRKRYRYVEPQVIPVHSGYRIVSPCCSRTIDNSGGIIDIALLQYAASERVWCLYRKDHAAQEWVLYNELPKLQDLLARINEDPFRIFWQ